MNGCSCGMRIDQMDTYSCQECGTTCCGRCSVGCHECGTTCCRSCSVELAATTYCRWCASLAPAAVR